MKFKSLKCLSLFFAFAALSNIEVKALDPGTLLAGQQVAPLVKEVGPVMKGVIKGTTESVFAIIGDASEILYLPLGVVESTLGLPFGGFGQGMGHLGKGIAAPFKVVGDVIQMPLKMLGGK